MSWERFKQYYIHIDTLNFGIDISRVDFDDTFLETMEPKIQAAYAAMKELEAGAIANPDENRRVGHYWLRNPELAPDKKLSEVIENCLPELVQGEAKHRLEELIPSYGHSLDDDLDLVHAVRRYTLETLALDDRKPAEIHEQDRFLKTGS